MKNIKSQNTLQTPTRRIKKDCTFFKKSKTDGANIYNNNLPSSFFDEMDQENEYFSLTLKGQSILNHIEQLPYLCSQILHKGALQVKTADNQINEFYFQLFIDRLEAYESPQKKYMEFCVFLSGTKMLSNISQNEEESTYNIILFRNQVQITLLCNNSQTFQRWYLQLKKCCIQIDYQKKYLNSKLLGKGSFGRVLLAFRLTDQKQFAVKIFQKDRIKDMKRKVVIQNEVQILRYMNHPNIIKIYEVYEDQDNIYLIMDHLTGESLLQNVIKEQQFDTEFSLSVLAQICSALNYIHQMGIYHRDLKLENILFESLNTDKIQIIDFGLSEFKNSNKKLFTNCGSPGFAAPEIIDNKSYDYKVDIFSAGVIFYNMISGCTPFFADTFKEVLQKTKEVEPSYSFEDIGLSVEADVKNLLRMMLDKNPEKRISSSQIINHGLIAKYVKSIPQGNITKKSVQQLIIQQKIEASINKNSLEKNSSLMLPKIDSQRGIRCTSSSKISRTLNKSQNKKFYFVSNQLNQQDNIPKICSNKSIILDSNLSKQLTVQLNGQLNLSARPQSIKILKKNVFKLKTNFLIQSKISQKEDQQQQ